MKLLEFIENKNYVGGEWITSANSKEVINPATGEVLGRTCFMEEAKIKAAVDNTVQNFKSWSVTPFEVRVGFLKKWQELVVARASELAEIITLEQGKTLVDAAREVSYAVSFIEWFASVTVKPDEKVGSSPAHKIITQYEAVGPVVAITPWNFPLAMITRKAAPAILAGCSMLLKPSILTPFSALALMRLAELAGLPGGVVNVVTGDSSLFAEIICEDFRIRKISFTGSTEVGKLLYQNSATTLKRLSLELGGNAPYIIFADVDIEKSVDDLIIAKTRSSGESCTSPNRVFIQAEIYNEFTENLARKFGKLKSGNGLDATSDIGPLIKKSAVDKITNLLESAKAKGAKVLCGGGCKDNFFEPTIIIDCNDEMDIAKAEIFGPVIACYNFETVDEVVVRANNTEYGLQAYICTKDIEKAKNISRQLDFGMVSINSPLASNAKAPFGGRKASGFGVEGGDQGIFEYLNTKYVNLNLP